MFPPSQHARFAPSKVYQFLECPGSFQLVSKYDNVQSAYALEGEMLHLATERCIRNGLIVPTPDIVEVEYGVTLNQEQINAVSDSLYYYNNLLRTIKGDPHIWIEQQVSLKQYDPILFECEGTADITIDEFEALHVLDWKYGRGVPVYADKNDQANSYLAGALVNFDNWQRYKRFHVHIVQPRLDNYDEAILSPQELRNWMNMRLIPGAQRAYSENAPFIPGKKQCKFCAAKYTCRARNNFANQTASDIFAAHAKLGPEVSIDELSEVLKNAEAYKDYIKDIAKYIQAQLMAGKDVPGWKMVAGRSNRAWTDEEAAAEFLLDRFDYDSIYKSTMVSPAQAEGLSSSLKRDDKFKKLVVKPAGKPTLVSESHKGQAINFRNAEQVFSEFLKSDEEADV